MRAAAELRSAKNEIMNTINQAESAVRNSLWIAEWCLENPDSLARVPQRVVSENSLVVGSTIALVPEYNKQRPLYAPYVTRDMASGWKRVTTTNFPPNLFSRALMILPPISFPLS